MRTAQTSECQLRGVANLLRIAGADSDTIGMFALALIKAHLEVVKNIDEWIAAFEAREQGRRQRAEEGA
jgi:hypothetical protein